MINPPDLLWSKQWHLTWIPSCWKHQLRYPRRTRSVPDSVRTFWRNIPNKWTMKLSTLPCSGQQNAMGVCVFSSFLHMWNLCLRLPKYTWCVLLSMMKSPEVEGDWTKMKLNHHKTLFPPQSKASVWKEIDSSLKVWFFKVQYVDFVQMLGCLLRSLGAHTGRRFGRPRRTAKWFCMLRCLETKRDLEILWSWSDTA